MTNLRAAILRYKRDHPEANQYVIARVFGCCQGTVSNALKQRPGDPDYKLPVQPYEPLPEIAELKRLIGLEE